MKIDLTGQKFGRWTVIKEHPKRGNTRHILWVCICECGVRKPVTANSLRQGRSKSCGCLNRDIITSHKMSKTRFFRIWQTMKRRCYEKTRDNYHLYGGRGIRYCERWQKFQNFMDDMHKSYLEYSEIHGEKDTSLDRIDTNGNYEPSNCRWLTMKKQSRNKRNNRIITYKGESLCISEWEERLGFSSSLLNNRLRAGWSEKEALEIPVMTRYSHKKK